MPGPGSEFFLVPGPGYNFFIAGAGPGLKFFIAEAGASSLLSTRNWDVFWGQRPFQKKNRWPQATRKNPHPFLLTPPRVFGNWRARGSMI